MNCFRILVFFFIVLPSLLFATHSIYIDRWETEHRSRLVNCEPAVGSISVNGPGILGGERDVLLTCLEPGLYGSIWDMVWFFDHEGRYSIRERDGARGRHLLVWDGPDNDPEQLDASGLAGIDMTNRIKGCPLQDAFTVEFYDFEPFNPVILTLTVYTDADNWSQFSQTITPDEYSFVLHYPYSDFVPISGAGADFTDVGALSMQIEPTLSNQQVALLAFKTTALDTCDNDSLGITPPQSCWVMDSLLVSYRIEVSVGPEGFADTAGTVTGPGITGGERDVFVAATSTFHQTSVHCSGKGNISLSNGSGTGYATLIWDGIDNDGRNLDPAGLGGIDLVHCPESCPPQEAFALDFLNLDHGGIEFIVSVYTDANNWSQYQVELYLLEEEYPSQIIMPFSDFTVMDGTGADFTNVGAVSLHINPYDKSSDLTIGLLKTIGLKACLGDSVWNQSTNQPVPGVQVVLLDRDGNVVDNRYTDGRGIYLFENLVPGYYTVFLDPANFGPGGALENLVCYYEADGSCDNDVDLALSMGENNTNFDFGYYNQPIAIDLMTFKAEYHDGRVKINWQTASEKNVAGYNILYRIDEGEYEKLNIGRLPSEGTATKGADYSFTHIPEHSGTFCYRLEEIDLQGKSHFYDAAPIAVELLPKSYHLAQNYPNPFNPQTTIEYTVKAPCHVLLEVFDVHGRRVSLLTDEHKTPGLHQVELDARRMAAGIYFYRIGMDNYSATRKMILVK